MKKIMFLYFSLFAAAAGLTGCLKTNKYFEDFSSTQPIADIPKALNLSSNAPALTMMLDSVAGTQTVDLKTAVHISAKEHVGDVTVTMKVDPAAGQQLISRVPTTGQTDYRTYKLLPDSLYTIPSLTAVIPNAGVFSVGDFVVKVRTGKMTKAAFNANRFLLPLTIANAGSYLIAANFGTIYYSVRVK